MSNSGVEDRLANWDQAYPAAMPRTFTPMLATLHDTAYQGERDDKDPKDVVREADRS